MSDEMPLNEWLLESSAALGESLVGRLPSVAIVLGTGLGPLAEQIEDAVYVPFSDIPHMKSSTATGHVGRFVAGKLGGKDVICMQGRLHGYEGNTAQEVAYPIWLMSSIGADTLITTNAAGAINESFEVGDFCIMSDHINFTGRNPIVGIEPDKLARRFFSMHECYDPRMRAIAHEVATELGVPAHDGVYLGLLGPSFETAAEIRAFRSWGADTVAMSVVEEVIAARHVGMRVLGMSLCTNMACGIETPAYDAVEDEVFETAKRREADFCALITGIVDRL